MVVSLSCMPEERRETARTYYTRVFALGLGLGRAIFRTGWAWARASAAAAAPAPVRRGMRHAPAPDAARARLAGRPRVITSICACHMGREPEWSNPNMGNSCLKW